jgi:hypothetical protein
MEISIKEARQKALKILADAEESRSEVVSEAKPKSRASWFNIRWIDEAWTREELKKAVEIQTALAWWFAQNDPGTPIPDWGYLFDPIDKAEILELWDDWNAERTAE